MTHTSCVYCQSLTFHQQIDHAASTSTESCAVTVTTCHLKLNAQGTALQSCELTVDVSPEDYQYLTQQAWFGFDPELCSQPTGPAFNDAAPLSLTLTLNSDWLAFLEIQKFRTAQSVGDYLLSLEGLELTDFNSDENDEDDEGSGDRPHESLNSHPNQRRGCALLNADHWFLLKVNQLTPQGRVEVRTFYDYIDVNAVTTTDTPDDLFSHTLTEFLQSTAISDRIRQDLDQSLQSVNLPGATATIPRLSQTLIQAIPALLRRDPSASTTLAKAFGAVFEQSLHSQLSTAIQHGTLLPPSWDQPDGEHLNKHLNGGSDDDSSDDDEAIATAVAMALEQLWQEDMQPQPIRQTNVKVPSILEMAMAFFEAEEWPFEQLTISETDQTPVLRLRASGTNGSWTCLMPIQEQSAQILFLSIWDQCLLPRHRTTMAQHLMDINYGLTDGNFELDSNDGEVRFRTSLNLRGLDLKTAPIHPVLSNVVYVNLSTMDQYLPHLQRLIDGA